MTAKNPHAVALGKLSAGSPKTGLTRAEIARRKRQGKTIGQMNAEKLAAELEAGVKRAIEFAKGNGGTLTREVGGVWVGKTPDDYTTRRVVVEMVERGLAEWTHYGKSRMGDFPTQLRLK